MRRSMSVPVKSPIVPVSQLKKSLYYEAKQFGGRGSNKANGREGGTALGVDAAKRFGVPLVVCTRHSELKKRRVKRRFYTATTRRRPVAMLRDT